MAHHLIEIRPVPVPGWVLHWPMCTCGWEGDLVRTHPLAQDQVDEHLADHSPAQPTLFD